MSDALTDTEIATFTAVMGMALELMPEAADDDALDERMGVMMQVYQPGMDAATLAQRTGSYHRV